jgi:hypothetical protein
MSETTEHRATVVWDADKGDLRAHTIQFAGQTLAGSGVRESTMTPIETERHDVVICHRDCYALTALHSIYGYERESCPSAAGILRSAAAGGQPTRR